MPLSSRASAPRPLAPRQVYEPRERPGSQAAAKWARWSGRPASRSSGQSSDARKLCPLPGDCVVGLLSSHRRGAGGCGLPGTRAQASGTRTPKAAGSLSERAENGGEARQGLGNCSAGRGVLGVPWGRGTLSLPGR